MIYEYLDAVIDWFIEWVVPWLLVGLMIANIGLLGHAGYVELVQFGIV